MLGFKAWPHAWAYVFNAYPGAAAMWNQHCLVKTPPCLVFYWDQHAYDKDNEEDLWSEVKEAPWLALTLKEYHAAGQSAHKKAIYMASAWKLDL